VNPLQDQRYNKVSLDESENREKIKFSFFFIPLSPTEGAEKRAKQKKREREKFVHNQIPEMMIPFHLHSKMPIILF
jgi:hypothetical protein